MRAFCGFSIAISTTLFFKYKWKHNNQDLPMCQTEINCTNSSRVEYIVPQEYINTDFQCKSLSPSNIVIKQISLLIHSAKPEDVGEYTCSSIHFDTNKELKYIAGQIHVGKSLWSSLMDSIDLSAS